jgi:hypothetical protein
MTRWQATIQLGERASAALGLPRNDCVDAFVWLLSPGLPDPVNAEPTVRAVAAWALQEADVSEAIALVVGGNDPLREARRWANPSDCARKGG